MAEQGGSRGEQPRRAQRRGRRGRGRGGRQQQGAVGGVTPATVAANPATIPSTASASNLGWPAAGQGAEMESHPQAALPGTDATSHSELPSTSPATTSPAFAPELQGAKPAPTQRAPKGVVVLTIGLPGSGKSTWFKRRGVTPLSSDMLRSVLFDDITEQRYQHLVFSTLRSLLRARLIARMPWNYVDATNLSSRDRRQWIQMARSFGYEVHAVFFDVPLEVCLERNSRRERQVPEDTMRRMAAKVGPPKFEEGFSKITVVRVKQPHVEA